MVPLADTEFCDWKNPGQTGAWWLNAWNGVLTEEEWHVNFRMSRADFSDLLETPKPYIYPKPNSFRPDANSAKKLAMTL